MHRGDLNFANSGELLRGKMPDSWLPRLLLLDSLLCNEIGNEAHLFGHSKVYGVISNDGEETRPELGFLEATEK
jgi:hypothetical protein